jgi:hypothetical protein
VQVLATVVTIAAPIEAMRSDCRTEFIDAP